MALLYVRGQILPAMKTATPHDFDPVIEAYKKDVDRTLIRENLKLTVEQRILNLMQLQRLADELKRSVKERPR